MAFVKRDIDIKMLPTKRGVIEYFLFLKYYGSASVPKNRSLNEYLPIVMNTISKLWQQANIPIVTRTTLRRNIESLLQSYYNVKKHPYEYIGSWELRNDQRYLFDMVLAVNNGECDEYLASKSPGPVSTARWLTTASRLLRVYVSKESPSAELRNMVEFVVKVYAPFWFLVKSQPQAIHGSRHVFKYICWIRELSNAVQAIIRSAIENNAYYFHPENILLAMITDADPEIRNDGYEKIKTARQYPPAGLRVFKVPKRGVINFESKSYVSMIDWSQFKITEPPCVQFYPDSELTMFQFSENEVINIPEFLCHSQNTERFVRVVSESASAVTDEKRLGHI
ncbi:uncharacterized protein LOC118756984, partial [Rhagoletis pomonella]